MDPKIDDYIWENRERYTREAIREQLVAAGHDPAAVDAAWDRVAGEPAAPTRPIGWRPRGREFFLLVVLGAISMVFVWADEPYGAGAIAPVVYIFLASIGFAIGKWFSIMVDAGNALTPIILLGLVAIGGAMMAVVSSTLLLALAVAILAGVPALLLFYLRGTNPNGAGMVGAAIPILIWLAVTGTCYAPLFARLGGG